MTGMGKDFVGGKSGCLVGCLLGISDLIRHVHVELAGRQVMMCAEPGRPGCISRDGCAGFREPGGIGFGVCSAPFQTQFSLFLLIRIHFFFFTHFLSH